jgi:hypothetical protein
MATTIIAGQAGTVEVQGETAPDEGPFWSISLNGHVLGDTNTPDGWNANWQGIIAIGPPPWVIYANVLVFVPNSAAPATGYGVEFLWPFSTPPIGASGGSFEIASASGGQGPPPPGDGGDGPPGNGPPGTGGPPGGPCG